MEPSKTTASLFLRGELSQAGVTHESRLYEGAGRCNIRSTTDEYSYIRCCPYAGFDNFIFLRRRQRTNTTRDCSQHLPRDDLQFRIKLCELVTFVAPDADDVSATHPSAHVGSKGIDVVRQSSDLR